MQTLNETEQKILKSLQDQVQDCTGGEFGYLPDADRCGLSENQFKGYVSQLVQKGYFEYLDTNYSSDYGGQYALKN